jgi:hypothetical protein
MITMVGSVPDDEWVFLIFSTAATLDFGYSCICALPTAELKSIDIDVRTSSFHFGQQDVK